MELSETMDGREFDVVIPLSVEHIDQIRLNIPFIMKNLDAKRVCILCNENVASQLDGVEGIEILDENNTFTGLSYKAVAKWLSNRGVGTRRAGWYLQQFLKMQYSYMCKDEYYVVWDADTIPLRRIEFLDKDTGAMLVNLKSEHHYPYFDTMDRLFGKGFLRYQMRSFISEGMIIKTDLMRDLVDKIGSSNIPGEIWYEKVINAIDLDDLEHSGFSEFETYGSFMRTFYPNAFRERHLVTERRGFLFYDVLPTKEDLSGEDLDTISFENKDKRIDRLKNTSQIIRCNKSNNFVQRLYFSKDEYERLKRAQNSITESAAKAQSIYIYGAGKYGDCCRGLLDLYGHSDKVKGYIVSEKKEAEKDDVPIYTYEEYSNGLIQEGDLIIVAAKQKLRREILHRIDKQRSTVVEFLNIIGENYTNIVRTREIEVIVSQWKEIQADKKTSRNTVIIDFRNTINMEEIRLLCSQCGQKPDLFLKEGTDISQEDRKLFNDVFFYPLPELPRSYSQEMEMRLDKYIVDGHIPTYETGLVCGGLPVKRANYLEAMMICIKCVDGKRMVCNKGRKRLVAYQKKVWSNLFSVKRNW